MDQPVTRDRKNEGEIIMMDMADVNYIQTEDGAVVFHTAQGRFYPLVPSLSTYANHMESLEFQRLDRTNLVNMKRVKGFDERRGVVYFEEKAETDSQSAIVAFMNIGKLKQMILSWVERNLK
jgi:DNA-binding LytR/AlgR family response regulator